ncbi:MAG: SH3 domain-containing protein [Spirochaetes bacterium]|nr:SH3 domain-containing protein [Spirochaetota bacterium]
MKKIIIPALLILASIVYAETTPVYYHGKYSPGIKAYLFGDNVRVRTSPEIGNNITATLPAGTEITVIENTGKSYALGNYEENWYKIRFSSGSKSVEGYIWGGLIAKSSAREGTYLYAAGITKHEGMQYNGEVRLINKNKIISSLPIDYLVFPFAESGIYDYTVGAEIYGNRGISGIDAVFEITMLYEACGAENGSIFIARKGEKLIYITKTSNVSEAGCFNYSEDILFPDDKNGVKDSIVIKTTQEDYDEDTEEYKITGKSDKIIIFSKDKFIEKK